MKEWLVIIVINLDINLQNKELLITKMSIL